MAHGKNYRNAKSLFDREHEYAPAEASDSAKSDGGFVSLIENGGHLSLWGAILALGLALVFGMFHALTPGHGKTMVAAYLAGTRGQARHALIRWTGREVPLEPMARAVGWPR